MLNLLCATAEEDLQVVLYIIFGLIALSIFIGVIVDKVKKDAYNNQSQRRDEEFLHPNARGQLTPEQSRYILNTRNKGVNKPTTPPQTTIDLHAHTGTAETYDPIVGSLGAVSDEGCDELNGVRLIVTDLMYQTDEDGKAYDLDAIRKSLILGEVLNNPRFKKPYGKK